MEGSKEWLEDHEPIRVVDQGMILYLSSLVENSTFDEQVKEDYFRRMSESMPLEDYEKAKGELLDSQVDKITAGLNYTQTDLVKHLRKLK